MRSRTSGGGQAKPVAPRLGIGPFNMVKPGRAKARGHRPRLINDMRVITERGFQRDGAVDKLTQFHSTGS